MHRSVLAAALLAVIALAAPATAVGATPTCFGKPATHVMEPGEGPYFGTVGDDVVVGTDGPNGIILHIAGGTDLACGGGGDDRLTVNGAGSKADGGTGRDRVDAGGGALARGGSGDDVKVFAIGLGSRAEGGSGADILQAEAGAIADGGSGNDVLSGDGAAALLGSSGSDAISNLSGNPKIDCGSAYDLVQANGATEVRRCEGTPT